MMSLIFAQNRNLGSLLNSAKPLGVEGNTVVVGFDYPILKEKFDKTPEGQSLTAESLSKALGRPCQIRCVVTSQYVVPKAAAAVAPPAPKASAPPPPPDMTIDKNEFDALAQQWGGVVTEE
jgi:hypothetical protein